MAKNRIVSIPIIVLLFFFQVLNGQSIVFDQNPGPESTVFGGFVVADGTAYLLAESFDEYTSGTHFEKIFTFRAPDYDPVQLNTDIIGSFRGPFTNGNNVWVLRWGGDLFEISSPNFPVILEDLDCQRSYGHQSGSRTGRVEYQSDVYVAGCNKLIRLDDQGVFTYDAGHDRSHFVNPQIFNESLHWSIMLSCGFSCSYTDRSIVRVNGSRLDTLLNLETVYYDGYQHNFYSVHDGKIIHDDFRFENGKCHEWIYRLEDDGKKTILKEWVSSDPFKQICLSSPSNVSWLPDEFADELFYAKAVSDSVQNFTGFDFVQITDGGAVDVDSASVPIEYAHKYNLDGPQVISRNTEWIKGFKYRFRNQYIDGTRVNGYRCQSSLIREDEVGNTEVVFTDESEKYAAYCMSNEAPFVFNEEVYFVRKYWGNSPMERTIDNSEIWKHDGDTSVLLARFENTPTSFVPQILGVFEDKLYFSGYEDQTGEELWSVDLETTATSSSAEIPSPGFVVDLFPNPIQSGNEVSLKTELLQGDVFVFDALGRAVGSYLNQELAQFTIDTMSLSNGLYLISVHSEKDIATNTLIVQR